MVRIRSDRWYSGENQRELRRIAPSNSNGTRRLISLVFLLALVLVLMAKVSDPKNMRQMFESLGIPLEKEVIATTHPATATAGQPATVADRSVGEETLLALAGQQNQLNSESSYSNTPWDKTCADLIPRLLAKATSQQIDQLAEYWFASQGTRSTTNKTKIALDLESADLVQQLREKLDVNSSSDQPWSELLTKFDARWQTLVADARLFHQGAEAEKATDQAKTPEDEFHHSLSNHLDRLLLENLRDGSPWSAGEIVGFGRLLQRAKEFQFGISDPPLVATKQLEGDFLKLRGSWIRYRATVRLIEQVDREQPLVDQGSYSVLWLRGLDGSTQPIAVYTTSSIVNQLKRSISQQSFPEVEIIGLVGKKLAYGSASGVEVTPTVFAGSIVQFAPDLAEQLLPQDGSVSRQLGITGFVGLVLGLIATVFIWRQLRPRNINRQSREVFKLPVGFGLILTWALSSSILSAQEPPWKSSPPREEVQIQVVQQRLQSAFDEQQILQIQQLIQGEDNRLPDSILRTLFALNQVGWNSVWKTGSAIKLSSEYELKPVRLVGWAWSVQPLSLSLNQQEWFSLQTTESIYRVQVQTAAAKDQQPPELISVFCRAVPNLWKESVQLKQPIQLECFSLSRSDDGSPEGKPQFHFAERVEWKMSESDVAQSTNFHPTIPANWLELAKSGWDLAWFDLLAANNQKRLSHEETEPLLKLLEITQRTGNSTSATVPLTPPVDSMRKPIEHLAAPIDWQVRLVSGSVVGMTRDSGIVKYYQFDGFAKIPNQTVNYTIPQTGQSITFENEFPVTIVTLYDQEFVPLDKLKTGEQTWQIGKTAKVQGRFLRLWSYESQRLSTAGSSSRQVAPLIVASSLTEVSAVPEVSPRSLWSAILLGVAMLSVVAWLLKDFFKKSARPVRR